jgi:octaprenyl-diphosphate synthase
MLAYSCAACARSSSHNADNSAKKKAIGEKVGIAFQIKDDLFDYAGQDVGKPTGNDIKEKKLTLPLIYTLNNVDKKSRREIIYIIKNQNTNKAKLNYVIDAVTKNGGIDYTISKMNDYKQQALDILYSFPPSEIRTGFEELVNFVTDRKY